MQKFGWTPVGGNAQPAGVEMAVERIQKDLRQPSGIVQRNAATPDASLVEPSQITVLDRLDQKII